MNTRSGNCGRLCSEEFWEGGVTPAAVQAELDRGADPLAIGDEGVPALAWALEVPHGHEPEIVRLLLEAGADPNFKFDDDDDVTLLHIAVMEAGYASRPETADRLPADSGDVVANSIAVIELLLEYGADSGARTVDGHSALFIYLAPSMGGETYEADPKIVKLLLEKGVGLTEKNETDAMIMVFAMSAGADPEVIRLLLEHGIDDSGWGLPGETPLHLAAYFGAGLEVFELLLENGVDATAGDARGRTPLVAALLGENDLQVIRLLLDAGAEVATRSDTGATPLHYAAARARPEVVRLLLERGADAGARDDRMRTPLYAMMDGDLAHTDEAVDPEVFGLLVENGGGRERPGMFTGKLRCIPRRGVIIPTASGCCWSTAPTPG